MKYHYFLICIVLFVMIILIVYINITDTDNNTTVKEIKFRYFVEKTNTKERTDFKYILLWTLDSRVNVPFVYMGEGQKSFLSRNCTHVNCFVTTNKTLLGYHSKFNVIVFPGPELQEMLFTGYNFPNTRSIHQKYVFASIESADIYDIKTNVFDEYFNWTWTYKLDSDLRWGYIVVRDLKNNIVGPKKDMNWLKLAEMDPVTEDFKERLKSKKTAAAWFASNCYSESGREMFVKALQEELWKYGHELDVYGHCGLHICSRKNETFCDEMIAKYYYFYLSFENSFSEDYVTEKLLRALKYDAVPIVYGGANYTRFMPDGIYLNALDLGIRKLVAKMNELINDPDKYANYFRWKNHYKYEKTSENVATDEYCRMCEILNDEKAVKETTIYRNFQQWWNVKQDETDLFIRKLQFALQ